MSANGSSPRNSSSEDFLNKPLVVDGEMFRVVFSEAEGLRSEIFKGDSWVPSDVNPTSVLIDGVPV